MDRDINEIYSTIENNDNSNDILKDEFYLHKTFESFTSATQEVEQAVYKYNYIRPHDSCNRLTPMEAHEQTGVLHKFWKKKVYPKKNVTKIVEEVTNVTPA